MKNKEPILITGIERSGISIIARILHICGIDFGATSSMFENIQIYQALKRHFSVLGVDITKQYPLLTGTEKHPLPLDLVYLVERIGVFKSSKMCQNWRSWHLTFPKAKWIIVRRKPNDIVESCRKTAYMNAFEDIELLKKLNLKTPEEGWMWWVRQHAALFEQMAKEIHYFEIWPERIAMGDYGQVQVMLSWLGVEWTPRIVNEIAPLLWKSKYRKGANK